MDPWSPHAEGSSLGSPGQVMPSKLRLTPPGDALGWALRGRPDPAGHPDHTGAPADVRITTVEA